MQCRMKYIMVYSKHYHHIYPEILKRITSIFCCDESLTFPKHNSFVTLGFDRHIPLSGNILHCSAKVQDFSVSIHELRMLRSKSQYIPLAMIITQLHKIRTCNFQHLASQ